MHALSSGLPYLEHHALVSGETADSIRKLSDQYENLLCQCGDGRLLHEDLHSAHILVDRETERVTGIIDFGEAQSGDPAWDLALFSFWEEAQGLDYLLEGYEPGEGATRDLPVRIPFYRLLQATSLTRWAHEYWLIEQMPLRWRSYLDEGMHVEW
jgi:aminoglycoside phosphotransferase (APT) family kinase protein